MPIVNVNDCEFYYEMTGSGPDVIFVHGEDHGIELFEHPSSAVTVSQDTNRLLDQAL
jgi:hypothetical protein